MNGTTTGTAHAGGALVNVRADGRKRDVRGRQPVADQPGPEAQDGRAGGVRLGGAVERPLHDRPERLRRASLELTPDCAVRELGGVDVHVEGRRALDHRADERLLRLRAALRVPGRVRRLQRDDDVARDARIALVDVRGEGAREVLGRELVADPAVCAQPDRRRAGRDRIAGGALGLTRQRHVEGLRHRLASRARRREGQDRARCDRREQDHDRSHLSPLFDVCR